MTTSLPHAVDPVTLTEVLDGRWGHVRRDARENLHDPDLLPAYGEDVRQARARVTRMARKLAGSGRVVLTLFDRRAPSMPAARISRAVWSRPIMIPARPAAFQSLRIP